MGTKYTVTESNYPANFQPPVIEYTDATQTVGQGDEDAVTVKNTYNVGALTVKKTVDSNDASSTTKSFNFKLTLTPGTGVTLAESYTAQIGDGEPYQLTFTGNEATFKLMADQSIVIYRHPGGHDLHRDRGRLPHGRLRDQNSRKRRGYDHEGRRARSDLHQHPQDRRADHQQDRRGQRL